jgi:hypothetical protein
VIPAEHTRLVVEDELQGACSWAERQAVLLDWVPARLQLRATLTHPQNERYFLSGSFDDYRALPPVWIFADAAFERAARLSDWPKGVQTPFGASIFILHNNHPVICAPFNRLAYSVHAGPHGDWGGPANWMNAGQSYIRAETVGDMLQAIYRDFLITRERLANP